MGTTTGEKPALPGWLYVVFLALLATATDEFVIAGVLPALADDLGVSTGAAGQLVTVFAVVYAVGAPTLAVVCERFPRRTVMAAALAAFVLANVAAAVAPGYWWLMAARVVAALAAAIVAAAAFATAAAGAPPGEQGRYLGVVTAGMTAALFTGVPLGSWLGGALGWRATFWLIAAVGTVAVCGFLLTAPSVPGGAPVPLRERLAPLRNTAVLRLVSVTFLAASGGLMFYTYLGPYTARVSAGASASSGASGPLPLALFLVGVAGLAGALLAGRLTDVWGPRRTLRTVLGGHAVALGLAAALVLTGVDSRLVLLAVIACWGLFAWGLAPPVQGLVLAAAGPSAGMTALALNISGLYLGTGVAGALGGAVVSVADVRFLPVAATALMVLSLALTLRPTTNARPATGGSGNDAASPATAGGRGDGRNARSR
ncbi:MFS transporter [Streptomyces sp. AJS327]|uniref:MFS transporter n=1 Tax=Streptomyces sp. AJS327 TaxID=2545265 RepID=UPI0015DFCC85|nr:MFS transporter [Streptomyces sp. AJS327]MBA0053937.1 MFS transporter [Streptomyces sp. AJS327]